jgi:hypothetical protein
MLGAIREGEVVLELLVVMLLVLLPIDIAQGVIRGKFDFSFTKRALKLVAKLSGRLMVAVGTRLSKL